MPLLATSTLAAVRMKGTGVGVNVWNDVLSVPMYADDVVVLSENHNDLQEILNALTVQNMAGILM